MQNSEINLYTQPPWTGVSKNAFGLPWRVECEQVPNNSVKTKALHLKDCNQRIIATTRNTSEALLVHQFAIAVMEACDRARRIVSNENQTSWDHTVVAEIARVYNAANVFNSTINELDETAAASQSDSIVARWIGTLSEKNLEYLNKLREVYGDEQSIAKSTIRLEKVINIHAGEHFIFKIMGAFASHVGISRDRKQGWPMIAPVRSIDPRVANKFQNAKEELGKIRVEISPELVTVMAAWDGVIIPSMNAFCRIIKNRLGIPRHFPDLVESLVGLHNDIGRLASLTHGKDTVRCAILNDITADITKIKYAFSKKIDGNLELLRMDHGQRVNVYRTFKALEGRIVRSAKKVKKGVSGQQTLQLL